MLNKQLKIQERGGQSVNQARSALKKVAVIGAVAFILPVQSYACGIKGTAVNSDG